MRDKIIEILRQDSRTSVDDMARMLGVSTEEISQTASQMEAQGVIVKYSVVVNEELLDGDDSVTAFIEVKVSPERDKGFESIAKRLQKFPEVQSVYLMSGSYDLLVVVKGCSLRDVASFVSSKLSPLANVVSTATHFLLKKYKENGIILEKEDSPTSRLKVAF
ncbi:MAG: Lrp/AsnC family transcriptional regulator [Candidatus Margulisiibacteriota bacterium]